MSYRCKISHTSISRHLAKNYVLEPELVQDFLTQRPLDVVLERLKSSRRYQFAQSCGSLETALCQSWNKMRHDHAIVPLADKWEVRARAQARSIANLLSTIVEAREGSVECYGYRIVG